MEKNIRKYFERFFYDFCKNYLAKEREKYFDLRIKGLENLPEESAIIVPNHEIGIDGPILMSAIPRQIHFLIQRENIYNLFLGTFLYSIGHLPLETNGNGYSNKKTIRKIGDYLRYPGHFVGIFSEGPAKNLIVNGSVVPIEERKHFPGAAFISLREKRPVIPVGLRIDEEIQPTLWEFGLSKRKEKIEFLRKYVSARGKIPYAINIGNPLNNFSSREELTERVREEIIRLRNEVRDYF